MTTVIDRTGRGTDDGADLMLRGAENGGVVAAPLVFRGSRFRRLAAS
jgi:hypothetical protein